MGNAATKRRQEGNLQTYTYEDKAGELFKTSREGGILRDEAD
jgi:hypothetical protein